MFTSSVRRAALSVPPPPISSNLAGVVPRAATSHTVSSSRCHQRRASSSKPSSPANGSKKLSDEEALASRASKPKAAKVAGAPKSQSSRSAKSVASRNTVKGRDESILHLPSVPSTQHITPLQLGASAFFSLHRPMSLTNGFPKTVTDEAFAAIFTPRTKVNKASEVIETLSSTVKKLDTVTGKLEAVTLRGQWNEETDDIRAAITAESYLNADTEHLDGPPEESLLPLLSLKPVISNKHIPFNPPPPPMPLDTADSLVAGTEAAELLEPEPEQRTYTTVLTIEESTHSNGDITYTARHSPLVADEPPTTIPTRFQERMRHRQEQYRLTHPGETEMLAISVKRQRKLKMKKHKYKKLMRRTRNLRRRLDRT